MTFGRVPWFLFWPAIVFLAACGMEEGLPGSALPGRDALPGWTPASDLQVFNAQNLYSLVNGQADSFHAYGFEQVAVQTYEDAGGATLRVEVWQMGTPADAYGLFTTVRNGEAISIGAGGDGDPGRRLDFWQDRYLVRLFAISPLDAPVLTAFAEQISGVLPAGGERPSLVARLPQEGLVDRSDLFFHQEISIQDTLWLGGQNLLALGPETNAVLARYKVAGEGAWLLVVEYADPGAASAAVDALRAGGLASLVAAEVDQRSLAAVFGTAPPAAARVLLQNALQSN
jgi:hypothetical protein